jgi:hypothetical protein
MNTTDKRKESIKKARKSSNETNILKGCLTFINTKSKKAELKNKLIDELLKTNLYNEIYDKYYKYVDETEDDNDEEAIFKYISAQEFKILSSFDFCTPEELKNKREGFYIQEIPLNI